jgi:hypothetical protein
MKTEEDLIEIIHDNEFILPADSNARFVFLDKENDEIIVELNVMLGSPKVSEEGEILEPNYRQIRHALRLKLKLSDFFMVAPGGQAPQRDINYTMTKLEEALKKIEELQQEAPRCPHFVANDYVHDSETAYHCAAGKCSWATGKHDEECDIVDGLGKDLKEARGEMFDLFHQECCCELVDGAAKYDNQCMSCYEYAEEKLIEWGLLKPEQCLRRTVKFAPKYPLEKISIHLLEDGE